MNTERPASRQPMPPHAKRVFKGVMFDVYQWEQAMFDGSTATFEKIKRRDTAVVIPVMEDGRIVISEQEQPDKPKFTSMLGGRVDESEGPLAAAKRELHEEGGFGAHELVLLRAVQPVAKIDWTVYTYIARGCRKVAEPHLDAGERITLRFVTFDEFIDEVLSHGFADLELTVEVLRALQEPDGREKLRQRILG